MSACKHLYILTFYQAQRLKNFAYLARAITVLAPKDTAVEYIYPIESSPTARQRSQQTMRAVAAALGVVVCVIVFAVFSGDQRAAKNVPWKSLETLPISVSKILGLEPSTSAPRSHSSAVNSSVYKGVFGGWFGWLKRV